MATKKIQKKKNCRFKKKNTKHKKTFKFTEKKENTKTRNDKNILLSWKVKEYSVLLCVMREKHKAKKCKQNNSCSLWG